MITKLHPLLKTETPVKSGLGSRMCACGRCVDGLSRSVPRDGISKDNKSSEPESKAWRPTPPIRTKLPRCWVTVAPNLASPDTGDPVEEWKRQEVIDSNSMIICHPVKSVTERI